MQIEQIGTGEPSGDYWLIEPECLQLRVLIPGQMSQCGRREPIDGYSMPSGKSYFSCRPNSMTLSISLAIGSTGTAYTD